MKSFRAPVLSIAGSLLSAGLLLSSCGSSETVNNRLVTPEQSAADLQRALQSGAITQEEYNDEMEKLRDN